MKNKHRLTGKQIDRIDAAAYDLQQEAQDLQSALDGQTFNQINWWGELGELKGAPPKLSQKAHKLVNQIQDAANELESVCEEIQRWASDYA